MLHCSVSYLFIIKEFLSKNAQISCVFKFIFDILLFNVVLVSNLSTVSINDESEKKFIINKKGQCGY